jgi:hemerythrin-like domain-containing protein
LGGLSFKDPDWSLQRFCAGFCGFVHDHHSVEDARLFPTLVERQGSNNAEFQSVIEKLVSDHRVLTGHLDGVERALKALPGGAEGGAAATRAIERLSQLLEEHLKFEEANLAPALNAPSRADPEDEFPAPPPERFRVPR